MVRGSQWYWEHDSCPQNTHVFISTCNKLFWSTGRVSSGWMFRKGSSSLKWFRITLGQGSTKLNFCYLTQYICLMSWCVNVFWLAKPCVLLQRLYCHFSMTSLGSNCSLRMGASLVVKSWSAYFNCESRKDKLPLEIALNVLARGFHWWIIHRKQRQ